MNFLQKGVFLSISFLQHKLFRDSSVYVIANVIRASIPFLLLPLLTRYLSPSDYGRLALFEILVTVFTVLGGLNASTPVTINFFKLMKSEFRNYLGTAISLTLVSYCILLLIIFAINPLFHLLKLPSLWLYLAIFVAFANSLFILLLTIWQIECKTFLYGISQIIQSALNIGLSLYFVLDLNWKVEGRVLGIALSALIFGIISISIFFVRFKIKIYYSTKYLSDILSCGIPLIPHTLGSWAIDAMDRFLISLMLGVTQTGLYSLGYQFGVTIGMIAGSFNLAWSPFLFKSLNENNPELDIKLVKFTYFGFFVFLALATILSLSSPILFKILIPNNYAVAVSFVPWTAFAFAASGMYYLVVGYIYYTKKTHLIAKTTLVTLVVNALLTYKLIKLNGSIGAAQALTISLYFNFLLVWIVSAGAYKMPWQIWRINRRK